MPIFDLCCSIWMNGKYFRIGEGVFSLRARMNVLLPVTRKNRNWFFWLCVLCESIVPNVCTYDDPNQTHHTHVGAYVGWGYHVRLGSVALLTGHNDKLDQISPEPNFRPRTTFWHDIPPSYGEKSSKRTCNKTWPSKRGSKRDQTNYVSATKSLGREHLKSLCFYPFPSPANIKKTNAKISCQNFGPSILCRSNQ